MMLTLKAIINKVFFHKLGIDKAISFNLLTQLLGTFKSVVAIILVTTFLTPTEQGFYYTFTSILAIQIFFEMGFSGIITQYAAHEKAKLNWNNSFLEGDEKYMSRLNSLLRLAAKWFCVMSVVLVFSLLIGGFVFFYYFAPKSENVDWQLPWIIMSITTALNLLISPMLAFYEGLGKVEKTAKLRFYNLLFSTIIFFLALCLNSKLYAYAFTNIVSLFINAFWIFFSDIKATFRFIWVYPIQKYTISWRHEIFPYQWKIAVSWMSGYFLFQLFNPILFSTVGAKVAGQMGMTQAALNGIFGLANSWFSTKVPVLSGYIARKEYQLLDKVFNSTMKQALFVMLTCLLMLFLVYNLVNYYNTNIIERFLPVLPFSILALASVALFVNNALATYLRCHKEEPYLVSSIVCGAINVILMFYTSSKYGITGMTASYFFVMIVGLIWGYFIFTNKKKKWHAKY